MIAPIDITALGPRGEYRSSAVSPVTGVAGEHLANLCTVPTVFVTRTLAALRAARPLPVDQRVGAIAAAGRLFATGVLGGLSVADYEHQVCRMSGVPLPAVRSATASTAHRAANVWRSVQAAQPSASVLRWTDPLTRSGRAVWAPRGELFGVHASGIHPGGHSMWLEALALGYRVAVRPNRREPFTAHRLVTALRESGFGFDQVALLPTDHQAGEAALAGVDFAYGGDDVIRRYAGDPRVMPQLPGRSKVLVTADLDWREHLQVIVDSISHDGGVGCVNATAVFVEGDPSPVAEAVAAQLALLPSLVPEDPKAVLPVQAASSAYALQQYLLTKTADAKAWLGGEGITDELPDGATVLRPAVHQVDRSDSAALTVELPFPCVWFAPWTREQGVGPLRDTLTLTALTSDEQLIDELVDEPTIANVHIGDVPTYWTDIAIPHHGFFAEHLMQPKAVIRG